MRQFFSKTKPTNDRRITVSIGSRLAGNVNSVHSCVQSDQTVFGTAAGVACVGCPCQDLRLSVYEPLNCFNVILTVSEVTCMGSPRLFPQSD